VQNGNAYTSGLGDVLKAPLTQAWASQSPADREMLRTNFLSHSATKSQYELGTPDPSTIAPESYTLDYALLSDEARQEWLLDLFMDYRTNVDMYPRFQEWLRTYRPKTLITWGKNDVFFIPPGAEAYRTDVPEAEIHMLDAGHFAGETNTVEIGGLILGFLEKHGIWLGCGTRGLDRDCKRLFWGCFFG
jgi:pimeloyl-ACP methyl ester carboxylesterase